MKFEGILFFVIVAVAAWFLFKLLRNIIITVAVAALVLGVYVLFNYGREKKKIVRNPDAYFEQQKREREQAEEK